MKLRPLVLGVGGGLVLLVVAGILYFFLSAGGRRHSSERICERLLARPEDHQDARYASTLPPACHGTKGEGQPNWRDRGSDGLLPAPPHDPSGHTWHHPDAQLFAITKHGLAKLIDQPDYRTAMPVYDGVLSDDEIVAVLSWIKAQWPLEVQQRHDEINAQYRKSLPR